MKHREALQADHLVELGEGLLGALRRGEIVTGGEGMGRVEADLQSLGVLHGRDDVRDFLEACAEAGALTRRGLEGDPDL